MSEEEKKEYEELESLLYRDSLTRYGKRKLIGIIKRQANQIEQLKAYIFEHLNLDEMTTIKYCNIQDTVDIVKIIKPIYNFKAKN